MIRCYEVMSVKAPKKAEEWIGRVTWMSRVNEQVEVDRGRMLWNLLTRPSMEYAAEVG